MRFADPRLLVAIGLSLTGMRNLMLGAVDLSADFWRLAIPGVVAGLGVGLFFSRCRLSHSSTSDRKSKTTRRAFMA